MMWKTKRYAYASALPAIAAALALSSTPAWSQEAQPTAVPDPISLAPPAPTTVDPATDAATVTESVPVTKVAPVVKPKPKTTTAKASRTVASKKPAATRTAIAVASPAAVSPVKPSEAAPAAQPQPIVDARPAATEQAATAAEAPKPALNVDEDAIMLGGGALALLALGGGAVAFARRRRDDDEEIVEETAVDQPMTVEPEPAPRHDLVYDEQPAIVTPSAFAWGNSEPARSKVERPNGETWVERAYRGPTPDNPSASLRKRLKRANFFDARERRVAAGKAEPIDADAGLPENVTSERELELA